MKNKIKTLIIFLATASLLSCKVQQVKTSLPKIENYTHGEVEIIASPFGIDNEIKVGKVSVDGTIQFDWPEIDSKIIEANEYSLESVKRVVGMNVCHDEQIEENNEGIKVTDTKVLFLYKYGQKVGSLYPATQKELEDNVGSNRHSSLVLGSTISWYYSDGDGTFKAKCTVNTEWENSYNFKEVTSYELHFKKGWNIVQHTLLEKEDWKNDTDHGSLPKTINKKTIVNIPSDINWYLKYWANDELLEIERQLVQQTPISKKQYESWLPEKLDDLKRTSYEVGKKLERTTSINNAYLQFGEGSKKIDVTILDCAGSKETIGIYTLMLDMSGSEWKDKTESGYQSSTKMDSTPALVVYDEKEKAATLSYNTNDRFVVRAQAADMTPEELWEYLKKLNVEGLVK